MPWEQHIPQPRPRARRDISRVLDKIIAETPPGHTWTRKDLARRIKISPEVIRHDERTALIKLKVGFQRAGLRVDDLRAVFA